MRSPLQGCLGGQLPEPYQKQALPLRNKYDRFWVENETWAVELVNRSEIYIVLSSDSASHLLQSMASFGRQQYLYCGRPPCKREILDRERKEGAIRPQRKTNKRQVILLHSVRAISEGRSTCMLQHSSRED